MSFGVTLTLPAGFVPNPLLQTATPTDNAEILEAGCRVLEVSRDHSRKLSLGEERETIVRFYDARCAELTAKKEKEKAQMEDEFGRKQADYDKRLQQATQRADTEARLRADMTAKIAEETARVREAMRASMLSDVEFATAKAGAADAKAAAAEAAKAHVLAQLSEALVSKEKALAAEQKKAFAELTETRAQAEARAAEADRAKAAEVAAASTRASSQTEQRFLAILQSIQDQNRKAREEDQRLLRELTARRAGSSTKGADNEHEFGLILHDAFSVMPGYKVADHRIESGDHVIACGGIKVMYENKNYVKIANKDQIAKAHRDMTLHPECNALVFVSKNTEIADHQKPGHFDIGSLTDGRPVIYVGKFDDVPDKVAYLQMIHMVIQELLKLAKKAESDDTDLMESYKHKISVMRRYFQETSEDLNSLGKALKAFKRHHKDAMDELDARVTDLVSKFGRRLASTLMDNDNTDEETTPSLRIEADLVPNVVVKPSVAEATDIVHAPTVLSVQAKKSVLDRRYHLVRLLVQHRLPIPSGKSIDAMERMLQTAGIAF